MPAEYDVRHRMRKKDGSYLWVRNRGIVADRDGNGKASRMERAPMSYEN